MFETQKDFECFKGLLGERQKREPLKLYHYCLMNNHFHFLVQSETEEALPRFMHWIQLGYARYFKSKHETTGHIFEERYRSPRIAEESYYLQCGRYIERNPVKAKIVINAEDYRYSSARYDVCGERDPLVTEDLYFREMKKTQQERQEQYKDFLRL